MCIQSIHKMSVKTSPHTLTHSLCFSLLFSLVLWESIMSPAAAAGKKLPYEISKGNNGLDKLTLRSDSSSVEVYLYGGHVTSWKKEHGKELIFLSNKSNFEYSKPIRGGIPLCFPQFSNFGPLASHGFARTSNWSIDTSALPLPTKSSDKTFVDLILKSTEKSIKLWPHSFEFRLRVTLGRTGNLTLTSRIRNTDAVGKPFNFTFAYHTYFSVHNISEVRIQGLKNLDYLDNTRNRTRFTDRGNAITINSEVDRIYLTTPSNITILNHEKNRNFAISKHGLPDAVVWNPWAEKAKKMVDFGPDEYKSMVCVEAAAIEKPITLNPGEEWIGCVELSEAPSSNYSGQYGP